MKPIRWLAAGVAARYWVIAFVAYLLGYWFSHTHFSMWFGDSLYYTSMTLMRAGHSYADSINLTGAYFHDANIWRLDRGYHSPILYDLIKPRVVYVWLSTPFVWLFGPSGMYAVPAVAGLVTIYLLIRLTTRFVSAAIALALTLLVMVTNQFWIYSTGIYTESLCVMFIAMLLLLLPWTKPSTPWRLAGVGIVIVLATFTRQMTIIPVAMVLGGWLWASLRERRVRSNWFPVGVTALAVGAAGQISLMLIAPNFDPFRQFLLNTGYRNDPGGAIRHLPRLAWTTLTHEIASYQVNFAGLLLWAAALAAGAVLWRQVAAGVYFAGLTSAFAFDLLNGTMTNQRYLYPIMPACVLILALGIQRLTRPQARPGTDATPSPASGPDRQVTPPAGRDTVFSA